MKKYFEKILWKKNICFSLELWMQKNLVMISKNVKNLSIKNSGIFFSFLFHFSVQFTQTYLKSLVPFSRNSKYGKYFANYTKASKICIFKDGENICGKWNSFKNYFTNLNFISHSEGKPAQIESGKGWFDSFCQPKSKINQYSLLFV